MRDRSRVPEVPEVPSPPPWVPALVDGRPRGELALVRVVAPGVGTAEPRTFEARVRVLYLELADRVRALGAPHPVRYWNYIPDIHAASGGGLDRYMTFNAGRFAALRDAHGIDPRTGRFLPTATGVGHPGADLVVDCLASSRPARNVENPRQRPAWRYSPRWGPFPPCFARATLLDPDPGAEPATLLVGGTASVLGEDSAHPGSLDRQIEETLANLAAIAAEALGGTARANAPGGADALSCYRELRAYHPRADDAAALAGFLGERFPAAVRIELVRAELCREELLVEIEGLAELPAPARAARDPRRAAASRYP